jgi:Protein of unknown function (DUF664)
VTEQPDLAPVSERAALAAFLDKQRGILVRKIEGVTDEDARTAPTASSLSCITSRRSRATPGTQTSSAMRSMAAPASSPGAAGNQVPPAESLG